MGRTESPEGGSVHSSDDAELLRRATLDLYGRLPTTGELDAFAADIGLVFQIRDDLLEVEQDTATLGKNAGSDTNNDKSTYPSTLGVEGARRRAAETQRRATDALRSLRKDSRPLLWLSDFILTRSY